MNVADATSRIEAQAEHELANNVKGKFSISTPHNYNVRLTTDLSDRVKDAHLDDTKI